MFYIRLMSFLNLLCISESIYLEKEKFYWAIFNGSLGTIKLGGDRNMYFPFHSPRYNASLWYTAVHDPLQFTDQFGSKMEIFDLLFWPFTLRSRSQNIFLISSLRLLNGAIVTEINQAVQNLSHNKIFDPWRTMYIGRLYCRLCLCKDWQR